MKITVNKIPSMRYKDIIVNIERTKRGNYIIQSGNSMLISDNYNERTLEKIYQLEKGVRHE